MTIAEFRAGAARLGGQFLCNLPAALLFGVAYFTFFSALWGPLRPWKLVMAGFIVIGLALSIRVRSPRWRRRKRVRQSHEERSLSQWPLWRRIAAVLTGQALCFVGIYQSLGLEVDLHYYPLLSALCLIVSAAIGVPLTVIGWPPTRWRRQRTHRRTPRAQERSTRDAPRRSVPVGGTSMHLPTTRSSGYSGLWGGVGSKPAPKVWTPGRKSRPSSNEPVPKRFQKLRLVRRFRSRVTPFSPSALIMIGLLASGFVGILVYLCFVGWTSA